jgi:hypothetical protein
VLPEWWRNRQHHQYLIHHGKIGDAPGGALRVKVWVIGLFRRWPEVIEHNINVNVIARPGEIQPSMTLRLFNAFQPP